MIEKTQRLVVINSGMSSSFGENCGEISSENGLPRILIDGDEVTGRITINTGENPIGNLVGNILFPNSNTYESENAMVEVFALNRNSDGYNFKGEALSASGFELVSNTLSGNESYQLGYRITEFKVED